MQQRDFILRMIEQLGRILVGIRNRILRGDDPKAIEAELEAGSRQAGFDLDLVRGLTLESLMMFVGRDGELQLDRAWLLAEILCLDGIQEARRGDPVHARQSLLKARGLYELLGPDGAMLTGIPDVQGRLSEVDETLRELGEPPREST